MYLGWFDDNAKKSVDDKITEAIAAYVARFSTAPNIVLVNKDATPTICSIQVRAEDYIRPNNFWVGWEDAYRA